MSENLKGYKAFELGLICRGKQYAENTIFEEDNARICHSGMHFCKNPLAVLDYYPLVDYNGKMSEFAEVEALDKCFTDDNEKYCTKKLKIGAKISFPALVQASVNFEFEKDDTKAKTKRHDKDDEKISSKTIDYEGFYFLHRWAWPSAHQTPCGCPGVPGLTLRPACLRAGRYHLTLVGPPYRGFDLRKRGGIRKRLVGPVAPQAASPHASRVGQARPHVERRAEGPRRQHPSRHQT